MYWIYVMTASAVLGRMSPEQLVGQLLLLALPKTYCMSEVVSVSQLAWPISFSYLMGQLISIVIVVFCGHIGEHELAVSGLGIAFFNIVLSLPLYGLSFALDNLGSQACGSGNFKRLGLIVQRSIIIHTMLLTPSLLMCWFCKPILIYLDQDPSTVSSAEAFIWIHAAGFPGYIVFTSLEKYMILQLVVKPPIVISLLANVMAIFACYIFIFTLNMGLIGAAWAAVVAYYSQAVFSIAMVLYLKLADKSWPRMLSNLSLGISMDIFRQWGQYLKFAVPSMLRICVECWYFELATVAIGTLGSTQLAVISIVKQLSEIAYMIPLGISSAATIRVGNALGAGHPVTAQKMSVVAVGYSVLTASVIGIALFLTKDFIGRLFIEDNIVVSLLSAMVPLLVVSQLLDSTLAVYMGVLTGCGLQNISMISTLFGYYLLAFPIGAMLAFRKELGVFGLWIGVVIGLIAQNGIIMYIVRGLNWTRLSIKAQKEAGVEDVVISNNDPILGKVTLPNGIISSAKSTATLNYVITRTS